MFLHAARVEFRHPLTGDAIAVEAPLAEALTRFLGSLEESGSTARGSADRDGQALRSAGVRLGRHGDGLGSPHRRVDSGCRARPRHRVCQRRNARDTSSGSGLVDALTYLFPSLPRADYPRLAERYRYHYLAGDHKACAVRRCRPGDPGHARCRLQSRGGDREESAGSGSLARGFRAQRSYSMLRAALMRAYPSLTPIC